MVKIANSSDYWHFLSLLHQLWLPTFRRHWTTVHSSRRAKSWHCSSWINVGTVWGVQHRPGWTGKRGLDIIQVSLCCAILHLSYLISAHLSCPHLTSRHLTSHHVTLPHLASRHVTSPCFILLHFAITMVINICSKLLFHLTPVQMQLITDTSYSAVCLV